MVPGTNIIQRGNCVYISIDSLSEELKEIIRAQLSSVWYGFAEVEDSPEIHTYKRTLESFLDRYKDKSEKTQKGMIGEMLAHILLNHYMDEFTSLSVLRNKEERSIKKGFDIIYFNNRSLKLWYSEVKSGRRETGGQTSSEYNTILLNRSYVGITEMFEEKRSSLWDSALIDVKLTISDKKNRLQLKELLDQDSPVHQNDEKKNVILISVLYHCPTTEPVDMATITKFSNTITIDGKYAEGIVISIQKKTFEKVAQFLMMK